MYLLKRNNILIFLLLIFVIPAILPLFNLGFFVSDDLEWMVIRFSAFYSAFKDGQIPVRFLHSLNNGYGYPVPTFLYPGFMYFGIPVQVITSNFVVTIKTILVLSISGSALFTYVWLNKFFSKSASQAGSVVAVYLPYRLYDLYTRGSVGELFALAWVPFVLWMIERKSYFWTAIGIFLLIISHNTMAVLFLPLIFIYVLVKFFSTEHSERRYPVKNLISILLGIGLSSFFIIPALYELGYTQFNRVQVSDPLKYFATAEMTGFISFLIISTAIVIFVVKKVSRPDLRNLFLYFIFVSAGVIFFSNPVSTFFWESMPSSWIQFPFRLLSILLVAVPFLAAFLIDRLSLASKFFVIFIITVTGVISALPFISPKQFFVKDDSYYFTNQATTTVRDEYMPVWVKDKASKLHDEKIEVLSGQAVIKNVFYNNSRITFEVASQSEAIIRVNTIFWPGWNAIVNGDLVNIDYNNSKGVMDLTLSQGNKKVAIVFSETPIRMMANLGSILSLIGLIYITKSKRLNRI